MFENYVFKTLKKIDEDAQLVDDRQQGKFSTRKTLGSGSQEDDRGDVIFRKYMIECKFHKTFTLGILDKFWRKICEEATNAEPPMEPVLIYKANHQREVVRMRHNETASLDLTGTDWMEIPWLQFLEQEREKK